jgi:cytochrome c553
MSTLQLKRTLQLKTTLVLGSFLSMVILPNLIHAQSADAAKLYHRSLAATCANCHGTDGKGVANGGMPLINTLSSEQILVQLKAFKSGAREGTIMPQIAKGYTDEQLEIIANQLGKQ